MKILKSATLFFILMMVLPACNDWLDEVVPQGKELAETYLNDETTAEKAVTGLYNLLSFTSGSGPDNNWVDNHYDCYFGEMISDNTEKGSSPSDYPELQKLVSYQFTTTFEFVTAFYIHGFWGVSRANYILAYIDQSTLDSDLKKRMKGEAYFFRAYYYFYLLRHYGGVPILDHEIKEEDFGNIPRASFTETIQFIINDLNQAKDLLSPRDGSGRASSGSAKGLLARVMLYRLGTDPNVDASETSWEALYNLTTEIYNSGEYQLVPNYATLFEEEMDGNYRDESLFEYTGKDGWSNNGKVLSEWYFEGVRGGSWYGWGFNQPTQDLVDAFDHTDPRLSCTVYGIGINDGIVYGGTTNNGQKEPYDRSGNMMSNYYNRKAAANGVSALLSGTTKAIFIIRYADVLLMRAEAAYYTGQEGIASAMVDEVRDRARSSSYCKGYEAYDPTGYKFPETTPNIPSCTSSGTELLEDIWKERRLELSLENIRTYDLIRTGRLVERVGTVKDDHRTGGVGPVNTTNDAQLESRIAGIRDNIRENSIHVTVPGVGGGDRYIPVLPIPPTEVTFWNIEGNPNN